MSTPAPVNYQDSDHQRYLENRPNTALTCLTPSRTKQSFADETNINKIMARFQKTGQISHLAAVPGEYGIMNGLTFTEALMTIKSGQTMFDSLPSKIRKQFNHDPAEFLEFTADPENTLEMAQMGLLNPEATSQAIAKAAAAAAAEPPTPPPEPPEPTEPTP